MNNITCCQIKIYLVQIIQIIKGRNKEEAEAKWTLFNYFAIALLSLMEQNKQNCEQCSLFLGELTDKSFEITHRTIEKSHDEEGNPVEK